VLREIGPALGGLFRGERPTVVVSPEVTGFLLGPLVASALGVGFVEAYRAGVRLPIAEPMVWADVPSDHRGNPQRLGVRRRRAAGVGQRMGGADEARALRDAGEPVAADLGDGAGTSQCATGCQ